MREAEARLSRRCGGATALSGDGPDTDEERVIHWGFGHRFSSRTFADRASERVRKVGIGYRAEVQRGRCRAEGYGLTELQAKANAYVNLGREERAG